MFTKRSLTHESGQALIQVALAMVVLLAFVALAVDVGSDYAVRRKMQNAADAGAMAGAMVLCSQGVDAARAAALSMALANGAHLQAADITIDTVNKLVSVPVSTTAHSIFARILSASFATTPVRAMATAKCGPISTVENVMPIAIKDNDFVFGQRYDLLTIGGAGNFAWLGWDGVTRGTPYLQCEIDGMCPPPSKVSVNSSVPGLPGVHETPLDTLVGKTITIVLYDIAQDSGQNLVYHVVGFAEFKIEPWQQDKKTLWGQFVTMATPSTSTDGPPCPLCTAFGSRFTQ